MTDKEFRRLSRRQLVEIIYELQTREIAYLAQIEALEKAVQQTAIEKPVGSAAISTQSAETKTYDEQGNEFCSLLQTVWRDMEDGEASKCCG